jgi:hypothetical protein
MFAVPFDQIAPIVERTPVATKKLASRARQKVRGTPVVPAAELARHRQVVSAFLAAARAGDLTAILAVLAPDVVRRTDPAAVTAGAAAEVRGARAVAEGTVVLARRAHFAELALVNGTVGVVVAPHGRLLFALTFTVENDKIAGYDVIADPRACSSSTLLSSTDRDISGWVRSGAAARTDLHRPVRGGCSCIWWRAARVCLTMLRWPYPKTRVNHRRLDGPGRPSISTCGSTRTTIRAKPAPRPLTNAARCSTTCAGTGSRSK